MLIYGNWKKRESVGVTDSVGSLVPVVFVIRADLTDLIQVVLKIPRRVDLHRHSEAK